jgi:hypothetical protein
VTSFLIIGNRMKKIALVTALLLSSGLVLADDSYMGEIIGGVAGGVVGNQIGGGKGKVPVDTEDDDVSRAARAEALTSSSDGN